jgi:tetratricopeptide (TPR) repeat protein
MSAPDRDDAMPENAPDEARSLEDASVEEAARAADEYEAAGDWWGLAGARRRQADLARTAGDLDHAEEYLRSALSLYIMLDDGYCAGRALTALAEIRLAEGDYPGAAELSRQAAERMPGDTEALTGLAYAEWQAGSPADAEVTFSQALHWDADDVAALAGRGQVRADLGSASAALSDLDRALKYPLDRESEADARSARALALAGLGRTDEAQAELAKSVGLDPARPRTRVRADRIAALGGDRGTSGNPGR